ncbi:hypothetical protein BBJ28_00008591 [Nothophytophthora sp. Chile5]|nr:hypothetical protein BBJ28_00008591 [Nothophytophthora sp. Chile5]
MGNAWSYYAGELDVFDKARCLAADETSLSSSSSSTFYAAFRQSVSTVALQQGAPASDGEREQARLALENWVREVDILYDQREEFPLELALTQELEAAASMADSSPKTYQQTEQRVPTTLEENILKGLCSNPLSTPGAIHQVILQLQQQLHADAFLRVVGSYPRASRLYASQQLAVFADIQESFRMAVLQKDYSQAARTVGKAAYADDALETKRKRLREASRLLRRSLEASTPSITTTITLSTTEMHELSVSRARDSFNQAMADESLMLLETQRAMERTLALPIGLLVGESLMETIQKLVTLYPVQQQALVLAVDCAEQYAVPPRQFWWTMLRVLARMNQWQMLLELACVLRPPIGYVPIVEVLLDEDQADVACSLLASIQTPEEREEVAGLIAKYREEGEEGLM